MDLIIHDVLNKYYLPNISEDNLENIIREIVSKIRTNEIIENIDDIFINSESEKIYDSNKIIKTKELFLSKDAYDIPIYILNILFINDVKLRIKFTGDKFQYIYFYFYDIDICKIFENLGFEIIFYYHEDYHFSFDLFEEKYSCICCNIGIDFSKEMFFHIFSLIICNNREKEEILSEYITFLCKKIHSRILK